MKKKRALVETRFNGKELEPDTWFPYFEGYIVDETENRYKIKRNWLSRAEWVPKNGVTSRVIIIKDNEE